MEVKIHYVDGRVIEKEVGDDGFLFSTSEGKGVINGFELEGWQKNVPPMVKTDDHELSLNEDTIKKIKTAVNFETARVLATPRNELPLLIGDLHTRTGQKLLEKRLKEK